MNRKKILERIKDKDFKIVISYVLDKYEIMEKTKNITYTYFFNPEIMNKCIEILKSIDLDYIVIFPFEQAERAMLLFYPDFLDKRQINKEEYYDVLRIKPKVKKNILKHKDYMGAIYNQGIKENFLGDIVVYNEYAYLVCSKEISTYLEYNMFKVGKYEVEINKVENACLEQSNYNIESAIVTAMRIDSIISDIFNISRNEANNCINERYSNIKL